MELSYKWRTGTSFDLYSEKLKKMEINVALYALSRKDDAAIDCYFFNVHQPI